MIPDAYKDYEILEYLNGPILNHRLDFALEVLRGYYLAHHAREDVRIVNNGDEESIQLLLVAKKKG